MEPPYDQAIPLLDIDPKETRIERDTCTPMFIAALLTIARMWGKPRCPSAEEWIRKLWYIYTMEYHSVVKRNTFESVLMRWMNLEPIIQNDKSEKERQIQCINAYIWNLERQYQWSYIKGSKGDRYNKQTFGLSGRRWGWDDLRETCTETCSLPYVKQMTSASPMDEAGDPKPVFWDNPEG